MDFSSGFQVGRIRGIAILVHWSWLLIFALLSWSLSEGLFGEMFVGWPAEQQWAAGVTTTLLFFVSVLLHELSHAVVAQRFGMAVPSITLFVFGGVSTLGGEMKTAGQEFRVAIAGPLMSWALAIVFGVIWLLTRSVEAAAIFGYLAWINAVLGAFNLLPGFPLDGGRVFRSIVWARSKDLLQATRVASRVGTIIAYGMITVGLINIFAFGLVGGLWYVLIGLFLKSASEGSYAAMRMESALSDVDASTIMREAPAPIHAALSIQRLVDEYVLGTGERCFLVEREGAVIGLIAASDVAGISRDRWRGTPIEEVMVPADRVITIAPRTGLIEALRLMQEHDVHQLPVLDGERLIGMVTRGDVLRQIELRSVFADRNGAVH
jgi:Zn-dependent protease